MLYRVLAKELVLPAGPNRHEGDVIEWPSEDLSPIPGYLAEGWLAEETKVKTVTPLVPQAPAADALPATE